MLSRRRQLAAKVESVEGTAETLAAADAKLLAYNPKVSFDAEMFTRDPVRASLSHIGKVTGKRPASLGFRMELRGSGTATTEPEWSKLLKSCGFQLNVLNVISIGTITSGPFQHGETITGTGSSATGRVVIKTLTGTATLYFVALTGTFQSGEVITGATSGATATTSSLPTAAGKEWKPLSYYTNNVASLTMATYEDGMRKLITGARGKVKFGFKSGEPVMMDFAFSGVEGGITDLALLTGIVHESSVPPAFLSAAFSIDAVAAKVGEMDIDIASRLVARDDIQSARGLLSFIISDREIVGSFNPEMLLAATHDFHTKWFNNTEMILDFVVGSTTGSKFRFYGPKVQYNKVDDEDRDGLQLAKCTFDFNGTVSPGDDELSILAL
jgi:hypothetical protein